MAHCEYSIKRPVPLDTVLVVNGAGSISWTVSSSNRAPVKIRVGVMCVSCL